MTDDNVVIRVEDVDIVYRVYADKRPSMRQRVGRGLEGRVYERVDAVKGLSLDVRRGEVLGIVGANGSGKSTLLRSIAGTLPVESGRILVRGEATLLGVGAALSPKLSGARNVLIGCMALGMSRAEAEERFDEIVDFAGVRHAIDRPLRTFSAGMKSRLHFAVATSVDPDILLIDEALATGDEAFREKSQRRIQRISENAKVVVIVTHNLGEMTKACTRAVWMSDGRLMMDGDPEDVVKAYRTHMKTRDQDD